MRTRFGSICWGFTGREHFLGDQRLLGRGQRAAVLGVAERGTHRGGQPRRGDGTAERAVQLFQDPVSTASFGPGIAGCAAGVHGFGEGVRELGRGTGWSSKPERSRGRRAAARLTVGTPAAAASMASSWRASSPVRSIHQHWLGREQRGAVRGEQRLPAAQAPAEHIDAQASRPAARRCPTQLPSPACRARPAATRPHAAASHPAPACAAPDLG